MPEPSTGCRRKWSFTLLVIHSWGVLVCYRAGRGEDSGGCISDFIRPSVFFLSCTKCLQLMCLLLFLFVCLHLRQFPEK